MVLVIYWYSTKKLVTMQTKTIAAIIAALVLAVAGYSLIRQPNQDAISASGAFALYPLMIQWGEEYKAENPNVKFEISAGGAGKGMTDALNQLVDLGMVSREVYPEETMKGAVYVAVAKDAVVITISDQNPVLEELLSAGVNEEKLVGVFITGEVTTWGQLVGRPEVTDVINVYTRSDACGAAATIAKYMGYSQEDLLGVGVFGDPGLAEAVKTDPLSIGYNNVNYAYDLESDKAVQGVTVVPLDSDGDGAITAPEDFYGSRSEIIEAIADDRYPSPPSRELNLVTKDEFTGVTLAFIEWVLTDGQESAVEAGYVPLSEARASQELAKLGK